MNDFVAAVGFREGGGWTITSLIQFVTALIGSVIPLALALCLLVFFWSLLEVFLDTDGKKRKEAPARMVFAIVAFFVVLSLGGLVQILVSTFLK